MPFLSIAACTMDFRSLGCLMLVLVSQISAITTDNRTTEPLQVFVTHHDSSADLVSNTGKCSVRLQHSLEKLRKRQSHSRTTALIDLSGYALHQPLRYAPYDMYVTDIKIRTPGVGDWVRVQKCDFSPRDHRVTTQILFNDLTVSGAVRLFNEEVVLKNPFAPPPTEQCNMTLRLRRAGLGIHATPSRQRSRGIEVRTEAKFMDPNFLSVHAYGCKPSRLLQRTEEGGNDTQRRSRQEPDEPTLRIITLGQHDFPTFESERPLDLHPETDADFNEYHKDRILSFGLHHGNENDRLQAVFNVQNAIAQQANNVFQAHGPFSNRPAPPPFTPQNSRPISTITELTQDLQPLRPVPHKPFEALFQGQDYNKVTNGQQTSADDVSREMEDVFLRGIKTLLTKYLEKQLELPLKEALLINIGYTVSYG